MGVMPEWFWGAILGAAIVIVGNIVNVYLQMRIRKMNLQESRRRDATQAAYSFMDLLLNVFGRERILSDLREKQQEFWDMVFGRKSDGTEVNPFKGPDAKEGLFEMFSAILSKFRNKFREKK